MEKENAYEYKEEVLEKYKKYNLIVHTNKEEEYKWLANEHVSIEVVNDSTTFFIDLEDEITIYFDNSHRHFYYETRNDFEEAMKLVDALLNNEQCAVIIYSNDEWHGAGFDKACAIDEQNKVNYLKEFFNKETYKEFVKTFKKYGVKIVLAFWDKTKTHELIVDKGEF